VLVVVVAIDLLGGGVADLACSTRRSGSARWSESLLASTITLEWPSRRCLGVGVVL
jgi:hypothetical protein